MSRQDDLRRIAQALQEASELVRRLSPARLSIRSKKGNDPITSADHLINEHLLRLLPRDGDGWLSEETADDLGRLGRRRVWVVDPLDGTREFVAGIPEWCISIGLVEDGRAVAGGICNPATCEVFLGSLETGLISPLCATESRERASGEPALVLASRTETKRGKWNYASTAPFRVQPVGSVAYKLARVAAGLADATWTLVPKHEWDVAAGVALVLANGGLVRTPSGDVPAFNRRRPVLDGLVAYSALGAKRYREVFEYWLSSAPI